MQMLPTKRKSSKILRSFMVERVGVTNRSVSKIKINFRKHKVHPFVVGHELWVGIKMWNEKQRARPPFTTLALGIKKLSQWKTARNFHPRVYQKHFLFIRQHATHNSTNAYYIIRPSHQGKRARLGANEQHKKVRKMSTPTRDFPSLRI